MSLQFQHTTPMRITVSTLLLVMMAGAAQADYLSPRDSQEDPQAGKVLAIILGTVVGGLSLIFLLFGLWLWGRIKKNRRLEAEEAARAQEAHRTSADTIVDGRDNELQVFGRQERVKDSGLDKSNTETTQTAV